MYARHAAWLELYRLCLKDYMSGNTQEAEAYSRQADAIRPPFLTDSLCEQHSKRLFTKAPELYPSFQAYGTSRENWYIVDGRLLRYIDGNLIKEPMELDGNH